MSKQVKIKGMSKALNFINALGSREGVFALFFVITVLIHLSEWVISSLAMGNLLTINGMNPTVSYVSAFVVMAGAAGIQFGCGIRLPHVIIDLLKDRKNIVGELIQVIVMLGAYYYAFNFLINANLIMDNVVTIQQVIDISWFLPEAQVKQIIEGSIAQPKEYQFAMAAISIALVKMVPIFEAVVGISHVNIELHEAKQSGSKAPVSDTPAPSAPPVPKPSTPPLTPNTPPPSKPPVSSSRPQKKGKQKGKI